MVFREQPVGMWTDMDFKLLEAYQITLNERCPQCGNPVWLCHSTSDDISWHLEKSVCHATREKEKIEWRKDHKGAPKAKDSQDWGVAPYMVPSVPSYRPEGTKLPRREDYYRG